MYLLLLPPNSSAPALGPSHRIQSFTHLFNVGSSQRLKSLGMECPSLGPTRTPASEGFSFLQSTHGMLQGLQGGYLLHHGPSWASRGESASPESSPQAAGSAPVPGAPPCFPPSGLNYLWSCFSLLSLTPFPSTSVND